MGRGTGGDGAVSIQWRYRRWCLGASIQLLGAGGGWTVARGVATPAGAVVAWALSDEGDDPRLTDRVGPPVSEREATNESDTWSRRWADWAGQGGRRWAVARLEKKRGGWAETISRAEIK
jgi:hypothetical protein